MLEVQAVVTARKTPEGFVIEACRTCAAPVVWATTAKGKSMPVNAEPTADGNVDLIAVQRYGRTVPAATVLSGPPLVAATLYVAHFVTCPDAGDWRRPR